MDRFLEEEKLRLESNTSQNRTNLWILISIVSFLGFLIMFSSMDENGRTFKSIAFVGILSFSVVALSFSYFLGYKDEDSWLKKI